MDRGDFKSGRSSGDNLGFSCVQLILISCKLRDSTLTFALSFLLVVMCLDWRWLRNWARYQLPMYEDFQKKRCVWSGNGFPSLARHTLVCTLRVFNQVGRAVAVARVEEMDGDAECDSLCERVAEPAQEDLGPVIFRATWRHTGFNIVPDM